MQALIVDNSRTYRQLVGELFSQYEITTDFSNQLSDAKQKLEEESYDVLCICQHLRDGSGQELIEYVQTHVQQVPSVIFLTSDEEASTEGLAIDKLIHKADLHQVIDQLTLFIEQKLAPLVQQGRILLVEDHKSTAAVLIKLLEQHQYRIDHFNNADKAWELFSQEKANGSEPSAFDLVITDMTLADNTNGLDLVGKVRKLRDTRGQVPIMGITGLDDNDRRLQWFSAGINDYLTKPILNEEFCVRANNLITQKSLLDRVHDQRRELHRLATTDKLTGCANRHSLTEYANKFVNHALRHQYPVSLLVIDLDHFKAINDKHGHQTGDEVLQAIGNLLTRNVREGDMAARFGGEEFVLLLNHCSAADAAQKAELIRQKIEKLQPAQLTVTASIGVSSLSASCNSFETLFQLADTHVYAAKNQGRNQVVFES